MVKELVFVWENFGPIHADRCEAVARYFAGKLSVIGIELASKSEVYEWESVPGVGFVKETLFQGRSIEAVGVWPRLFRTLKVCFRHRSAVFFLCHYEHPATFLTAIALRICGKRVIVMNISKYDDNKRILLREIGKSVFYLPYCAAIASGDRGRDYLRFLGIPEQKIAINYNAVSLGRIRRLAAVPPAPDGPAHSERHFTIVARLVPKKNLFVAIEAYWIYRRGARAARPLYICGSGELESALKRRVQELGLVEDIIFTGFLQTEETCRYLGKTLALLLPSIEEQYGNVVIEAQALNIPVIVSENCGARDRLVRNGVNGFVVEPDNPEGMAFFMSMLSEDEALWTRMANAVPRFSPGGDVGQFAEAVASLVQPEPLPSD
ncbi:glycosyltransferase family 4 protein [Xanthobacteraceae bacterium Astr-EGSB]|uniref:glycosyltransferase family 4 protein n=1 Tax=Astrobacterium formosum TaxID=3069710 RepID=UPI0027B3BE7C|nr:glycosyltransferase family 4 protein [Xanthobacteraceae bacterium Astr-EGSB]